MNLPTNRRGLVFNADPFKNSTVGFDPLFDQLSSLSDFDAPSYPPYNIRKIGNDGYELEMALAGFSKSDVNVEVKEDTLTVSASKEGKDEEDSFLHRGIANRSFRKTFQLADYVSVSNAYYTDGLLHIDLERELPEAMKPRSIKINNTESSVSSSNNNAA